MATTKGRSGHRRSDPQVSVKRKRIELITISDDEDEVDPLFIGPNLSSDGLQDPIPNPIPVTFSTTTNIRTKMAKLNLDQIDNPSGSTHKVQRSQGSQSQNAAQPKKIPKTKLESSLQRIVSRSRKNVPMIPGFSVAVNSALNKAKLKTDYVPVKSETTVNNSDQPPLLLPFSRSPPLHPPLPEVIALESPPSPSGEFPLLPPPPQWADDPLSTSPPFQLVGTDPTSNSRMGSRLQAQEIAEPLQSASSSRNGKTSKTFRVKVKDAAKVKSRKEKGRRRTHKMRLRFRETRQDPSALLPQKQPQILVSNSDNSAVSITGIKGRKRIGGNQEKGQLGLGAGTSQKQKPRFLKQQDQHLICVTPVNGTRCYACKFCRKTFVNHSNGAAHVRIHTGDKPFKCSHCGKGFAIKFNLTEHEFIHTGQKDLKCKFCSQVFRHHSSRSLHHHRCAKRN